MPFAQQNQTNLKTTRSLHSQLCESKYPDHVKLLGFFFLFLVKESILAFFHPTKMPSGLFNHYYFFLSPFPPDLK